MKMIARMFCAAALVLGALSLTGCGEKKDGDKKDGATNATEKAKQEAPKAPEKK